LLSVIVVAIDVHIAVTSSINIFVTITITKYRMNYIEIYIEAYTRETL